MGSVNGFVAACGPASAAWREEYVVSSADEDLAICGLLLLVTLQAERRAAGREQFFINAAVRSVASRASIATGFMFEYEGPCLSSVALDARVAFFHSGNAATHYS